MSNMSKILLFVEIPDPIRTHCAFGASPIVYNTTRTSDTIA